MTNSRSPKNDNSSSESYTASSNDCNKNIKCTKENKCTKDNKDTKCTKDNKDTKCCNDKVMKINNKLSTHLKQEKIFDKKMEKKIEKLSDKIKKCDIKNKTNKLDYETIVKRLRKEKYLMVNGADSYGMFYSFTPQIIDPNNQIILEKQTNILNLCFVDGTSSIKILRSGIYVVNLTCRFEQPGQIALFINDNPELSSLTATNNQFNQITIHQILNLQRCDLLSIRNYLSTNPLTTALPTNGLIPESKNISLNLWKIAPEPDKCALPPKQNKEPWCYFESESSSSDTDTSSKCSKSKSRSSSECSYEESSELSPTCFNNPSKYSN